VLLANWNLSWSELHLTGCPSIVVVISPSSNSQFEKAIWHAFDIKNQNAASRSGILVSSPPYRS
jgi:hypothetical protein